MVSISTISRTQQKPAIWEDIEKLKAKYSIRVPAKGDNLIVDIFFVHVRPELFKENTVHIIHTGSPI
jgi:hypothetical protein